MSDIFQEVEEDVRRERYEQLWKKYGNYMVAAAIVVVMAVGGYGRPMTSVSGSKFPTATRQLRPLPPRAMRHKPKPPFSSCPRTGTRATRRWRSFISPAPIWLKASAILRSLCCAS